MRLNEGRGANDGDMVSPMAEARARVEAAFIIINVDENNGNTRKGLADIIVGSGWCGRSEFFELLQLRENVSRS